MLRGEKNKRQQKLRDEIILLKRVGSMEKSHMQQFHGVSSGRSLRRGTVRHYMIRIITVSVSSQRDRPQHWLAAKGFVWEMLLFALRRPSHFCRPDGSGRKYLIHSPYVITRWGFGVKKQVHEGQTLRNLHLEERINWLWGRTFYSSKAQDDAWNQQSLQSVMSWEWFDVYG